MKNIVKILVVIVFIITSLYTFNSVSFYSSNEDLQRITDAVTHLSLKCYSIEGKYPKTIEYLKENYGLLINEDDYQVIYYYQGDNLQPRVEVFKKEKHYE
ncbi:MAG: hypothetical protein ACLR9T_06795 [Thomasclavelia sp.]|uniref:hypothetical protein n=1 Tax=Thomasclavelia sp. TaxID=3025757 RepID=UPI0039A2AA5E